MNKKAHKSRTPRDSLVFYVEGEPRLKEPYHFKSVGLPNVYLLNGVTIENDPSYGRLVSIDNLEGLLGAIGLRILEKIIFSGAEFRFLRRQMKLTQSELGRKLGVTEQTVANYEKEVTTPPSASLGLGLRYLLHVLPPNTPTSVVNRAFEAADKLGISLPEFRRRRIARNWHDETDGVAA